MKEINKCYFGLEENEVTPRELKEILVSFMPTEIADCIVLYIIGEYEDGINQLKYDDNFVNGYRYLTACLLETLRFRPSVPFLVRYAVKDVEIKFENNVYTISKGDCVAVHCYSYSRMKHIFGDDAQEFNPLRFYEKGITTFDDYQYPYFNVNPRLCLGKNVAIVQAKIVAIVVEKFCD